MHSLRSSPVVMAAAALIAIPIVVSTASTASGRLRARKAGTIEPTHALAFVIDKPGDPRHGKLSMLLSKGALPAAVATAPDPEAALEDDDRLRDSDTVSLHMTSAGNLLMIARFRRANAAFIADTENELAVEYTRRTATRLEGRLSTRAPVDAEGDRYDVDLRFGVDVPKAVAGSHAP
jgi:hypothetical protein